MKCKNKKNLIASLKINRNMRCIEMSEGTNMPQMDFKINRNMRCIEIIQKTVTACKECAINRNMRCIEISTDLFICQLWIYD